MSEPTNTNPSKLLVEEYFAARDSRFLKSLRTFDDSNWLASFSLRWATDRRPWAQQQIEDYLLGDQNLPGT